MNNQIDTEKSEWSWTERMGIVAACAAALFVFKGDVWRFVANTQETIRDEVREKMPLNYEINRARELAAALVPDLRRNHEVIVRERVEIEELRAEIEQSNKRIQRDREELIALRAKLKSVSESSHGKETKVVAASMRRELQHRFQTLQTEMSTEDSKVETLKYRQESLEKAMAGQQTMLHKKRELEAKVSELETRLKLVAHEGVENQIVVDHEHLVRCEEQLRYLKKRLTIAEGISKFDSKEPESPDSDDSDVASFTLEAEIDRFLNQKRNPQLISTKPQ